MLLWAQAAAHHLGPMTRSPAHPPSGAAQTLTSKVWLEALWSGVHAAEEIGKATSSAETAELKDRCIARHSTTEDTLRPTYSQRFH